MPLSAYVWVGVGPVPEDPSPKSHAYVSESPSGSEECLPSNDTVEPSAPLAGGPALATGARLTTAVTVASAAPIPVIVAHRHVDGERAGLAGRIGVTEMERGSRQRQRLVSGTVSVIHRCRPCVRAG